MASTTGIGGGLARLWRGLSGAVYPPVCPLTREETLEHGTLAPAAWRGLALISGPRCRCCGRGMIAAAPGDDLVCELCLAAPRAWARGAAAFRYEGTGRELILSLKHADRLDLAPMIAAWMWRAGPGLVAAADLVAPVPLHRWRLLRRRHNQSAELARALCRHAGRRDAFAPRLLRRTRATPTQDGRDRAGRIANVEGAFALSPGGARRVAGRRVLLVDDVMTTGATLDACATACRAAGALGVDVLVAALVNAPGEARPGDDREG